VGDCDGIVVAPQAGVGSAIATSLAREAKAAQQRKAIRQGSSTIERLQLADTLKHFGLA
jgi:4-hydroxy-4-methyl-2-oxoglutarate aldolase